MKKNIIKRNKSLILYFWKNYESIPNLLKSISIQKNLLNNLNKNLKICDFF
jgi:hypothetical protein